MKRFQTSSWRPQQLFSLTEVLLADDEFRREGMACSTRNIEQSRIFWWNTEKILYMYIGTEDLWWKMNIKSLTVNMNVKISHYEGAWNRLQRSKNSRKRDSVSHERILHWDPVTKTPSPRFEQVLRQTNTTLLYNCYKTRRGHAVCRLAAKWRFQMTGDCRLHVRMTAVWLEPWERRTMLDNNSIFWEDRVDRCSSSSSLTKCKNSITYWWLQHFKK